MMLTFAARRAIIALIVLFAISIMNFLFINLAPGDPLQAILPREAGIAALSGGEDASWLRDSIPVRYLHWLGALSRGDLGKSFQTKKATTTVIADVVPATLVLTGAAMALSLTIGVPLGILSAFRVRSRIDHITTILSFALTSIPGFFLSLIAIFVFAIRLRWFPPGGMHAYDKPGDFLDLLRHLILPMSVLGILNAPVYARYVRASVLEVLAQDYIRTARAKGLRERAVVTRHLLPNAVSPLITVLGLSLPGLVGGSVLIEQVFDWPGLGRLSINAALYRDYPVFMGTSLLYAVAVLASNLIADLVYAAADPRIRLA
jgi:peptide/nickel transport system permease protein